MLPFINRKLPPFLAEKFFWRVSRHFNAWYKKNYNNILLKKPSLLFMKGIFSDTISQQLFFQGYYDYDLTKLIIETAKNGGVFVDVGANIGYFSLLFASQNKNCSVFSFEPSLKNLDLIKHNITANGLGEQITIYPYAAGNQNAELYFENGPNEQTGWGHISEKKTAQKVKVVRLDDILDSQIQKIDLLKIDVEGFDIQVILGATELMRKGIINKIVFEYHHQLIDVNMEELTDMAKELLKIIKLYNYSIRKFATHDYLVELNTFKNN
jgi:FkbM family methyltransferase